MKRYALIALARWARSRSPGSCAPGLMWWTARQQLAAASPAVEGHAPTAAEIATELERRAEDRREEAKSAVLEHPGQYLEFSRIGWRDQGWVNQYRELTAVDVTNHAPFPVRVLKADVTWHDGPTSYGTVPLELHGTVQPGETKHFDSEAGTLDSTTLECAADDAQIAVRQVQLIAAGVR